MDGPRDWRGTLTAAVPIPFDERGEIHLEGLHQILETLDAAPLRGVALGMSAGRGLRLSDDAWSTILTAWRERSGPGKRLLALAGPAPEVRRPFDVIESAATRAAFLAELGVDILVAQPPAAIRGRPERDNLVLEYHSALAGPGLPILISYRRETSGGIAYSPEVLAQLLSRPEVLGVEIATIDGIVTFQQVEALTRQYAPGKLVISGEERFLGYSLMCGADAALVGIGAAYPGPVSGLIQTHLSGDATQFLSRSAEVDALARPIFRSPLDGSTRRLLSAMVELGTIPQDAGFDGSVDPRRPR